MDSLARSISGAAGRVVIDKTGLESSYEFTLRYSRQNLRAPVAGQPPVDDALSIFAALQEQLGLKLEPGQGSLQVVVIDRIERPTED